MIKARFLRLLHQLRNLPGGHRAVTAREGFHGPTVLVACDCGKVFWKDGLLSLREAEQLTN